MNLGRPISRRKITYACVPKLLLESDDVVQAYSKAVGKLPGEALGHSTPITDSLLGEMHERYIAKLVCDLADMAGPLYV